MNTGCPACSAPESGARLLEGFDGKVVKCQDCGGIYTTEGSAISLARSAKLVFPGWSDRQDMDGACYYDLTVVDFDGAVRRRHGWFDPDTKLILQAG